VAVSFVDIDAIVGHYCLNFIFIKWTHIVHNVCQWFAPGRWFSPVSSIYCT